MKDIYDIVANFRKYSAQPLALATLVRIEGSSYRRPGARMLICADGHTIGSLSGGCIEEEIAARARVVMESSEPATVTFDARRRFGCHGKIDIFIERPHQHFFADLETELAGRRHCSIITTRAGSFVGLKSAGDPAGLPDELLVQEVAPALRVLIFGEGPDSIPLCRFSKVLFWEAVQVLDPASLTLAADDRTAAIVKSHSYPRDFAALQHLLPLDLRYVGLIGPPRRRDQLLNDLLDVGVTINAGFFAPAGLDLGAETPEEIALAIVSEIQRVFADGSGESLRDSKRPIHSLRPAFVREQCTRSAR